MYSACFHVYYFAQKLAACITHRSIFEEDENRVISMITYAIHR